jgi:hypothetical protein
MLVLLRFAKQGGKEGVGGGLFLKSESLFYREPFLK